VPNQLNGIICRNFETAKKIQNILEKFKNINDGINLFNYFAFHKCPEETKDCYKYAIQQIEKIFEKKKMF